VKPKISSAPASTSGEASQSTILSATTTATTFAPLSEKERERRRLKRQRYRQNKLRREKEVASGNAPNTSASAPPLPKQNPPDDAPVAFIRAESIENTSAPNPNPNPDPKAQ
jgi:hypothetical protein